MDAGGRFIVAMSGSARLVSDDEPLYVISVAAEMAGMHPQTLRQYDRLGLVSPRRTGGGGRRYSLREVDMLREVQRLSQEDGVNLVGIKRIMERLSERRLASMRRRSMGFVFQEFNLLPALTGRENMMLPLLLDGERIDRRWLESILTRTGMAAHIDRHPHELSGGEQQRVAIGRALMIRPRVIFADEPTGALDSRTSKDILGLLRESVDELGQTVVMVTHEPMAASYADYVLFLRDGAIVETLPSPTMELITGRLATLDA